ncbi:MAG: dihydrofolate reductase, partial [Clostridiales bacterium]|nr:dihydrofolate reductase [Clostridiales bacterium]
MHEDFSGKKVYVATSGHMENHDNIYFIKGDICDTILEERLKEGGDIFLFGGGILIDSFLKADIIDEYIIGIIPAILGKGRPLFLGGNPAIRLKLDAYSFDNGIAILYYSKRD